jgi:hypothetical protein
MDRDIVIELAEDLYGLLEGSDLVEQLVESALVNRARDTVDVHASIAEPYQVLSRDGDPHTHWEVVPIAPAYGVIMAFDDADCHFSACGAQHDHWQVQTITERPVTCKECLRLMRLGQVRPFAAAEQPQADVAAPIRFREFL